MRVSIERCAIALGVALVCVGCNNAPNRSADTGVASSYPTSGASRPVPASYVKSLQHLDLPVYPGATLVAGDDLPVLKINSLLTLLLSTNDSTAAVVSYYTNRLVAVRKGVSVPPTVTTGKMEGEPTTIVTQNYKDSVSTVEIKPSSSGSTMIQLMRLPGSAMSRSIVSTNLNPQRESAGTTLDQQGLP